MSADWIKPKGFHFFEMPDSTAIFIDCGTKVFVIQAEYGLGERLQRAQHGKRNPRPQTHELLADTCAAFGAKIAGIAFTKVRDGVFYTVVSLRAKNELGEKFVELDARPSDALLLAFSSRAPVLVSKEVLDACDDASGILKKIQSKNFGE